MKCLTQLMSILLFSATLFGANAARAEMVYIGLTSVGAAESGCIVLGFGAGNFNDGGYLVIDPGSPGAKQMQALAMSAISAGKPIIVNRERRAAGCYGVADYATDLRITN